ncbi:MAG: DUF1707 SHOCT-like domain-containing protein [Trebonia sp.]
MASGFEMRVGHAERDAVAAELREHYASGRLTLEELNERLDKTFAARTKGDLNALMTDLPSAPGTGAGAGMGSGTGSRGSGGRDSARQAGWSAGSLGAGSLGAGSGTGWDAGRRRVGQTVAAVLSGLVVVAALMTVGFLGVFGIGAGRPFGIVLILAALAFLRRMVFGRRHRARGSRSCRRW